MTRFLTRRMLAVMGGSGHSGLTGVFKKLRARLTKPDTSDGAGPHRFTAMVVLREPVLPDRNTLLQVLRAKDEHPSEFTRLVHHGNTLTCAANAMMGAVALIPAAIRVPPNDPSERHVSVLPAHRAHLLCSLQSQIDGKTAAYHLTQLVSACVAVSPASAVLWAGSQLLHPASAFRELAERSTLIKPPLDLWIRFTVRQQGPHTHLRTDGLNALGFMEIEVHDSERNPKDVLSFTNNVIHYLLDNGPVLKHGQALGMSVRDGVHVRVEASRSRAGERVYSLRY